MLLVLEAQLVLLLHLIDFLLLLLHDLWQLQLVVQLCPSQSVGALLHLALSSSLRLYAVLHGLHA